MTSVIFVIIILIISANAESCNYATFTVETLYPPMNIGTFSISTNVCQSLKARFTNEDAFLGFGFDIPFDGSLMMKCVEYTEKYYQIEVNLYEDALCKNPIGDDNNRNEPMYVDMDHNQFTVYNNIQFSLDSMSCNSWKHEDNFCGISMEMANNCSWSDSKRYVNISVPDNKCISLAPDFKGILDIIPSEILPEELGDNLEKQSLQFSCCSSDNSLLISNYSDTQCMVAPDSQRRISNAFNGKCFILGNDEDMIENENERSEAIHFNENTDDTYVYIMRWTCNDFEDECDEKGIPIMGEDMLPQQCSLECVNYEKHKSDGKNNDDSGSMNDSKSIAIIVVVIVAAILLFAGVIVVVAIWYRKRKIMQNQMERNLGSINMNVKDQHLVQSDDKYEAFVSETEQENIQEAPQDT